MTRGASEANLREREVLEVVEFDVLDALGRDSTPRPEIQRLFDGLGPCDFVESSIALFTIVVIRMMSR